MRRFNCHSIEENQGRGCTGLEEVETWQYGLGQSELQDKKGHLRGMSRQKGVQTKHVLARKADLQRRLDKTR